MFHLIVVLLFIIFSAQNVVYYYRYRKNCMHKIRHLDDREKSLLIRKRFVDKKYEELGGKLHDAFFVYELSRDISPLMEKRKLIAIFKEKLQIFGGIRGIEFSQEPREGWISYRIKGQEPRFMNVDTGSTKVKEYLPVFLHELTLCLDRIELYRKLQELSIHDALTGVFNRRYFMERFREEFGRARKFTLKLSFLMVDIDFFKNCNDTYGHVVGDAVLREIAKVLRENVREIDFVARFGGEEFAVLLTETDREDAIMVAKRIVKTIGSAPIKAFDEQVTTTVSIGVATYPESTTNADMLIEIADKALYKAKESGRNITSYF